MFLPRSQQAVWSNETRALAAVILGLPASRSATLLSVDACSEEPLCLDTI